MSFHFSTLDTLQIKRLADISIIEQIFHHKQVSFRLNRARLQIFDLYRVKSNKLGENRRFACCGIHIPEVGRREFDQYLPLKNQALSTPAQEKKD